MRSEKNKTLIINGLRSRSGGSKVHLSNFLYYLERNEHGFKKVILIANKELRDACPSYPWLQKIVNPNFDKSVFWSVFWELYSLKKFLSKYKNSGILLNLDGNYLGPFVIPTITMSRDMLSFEPGLLSLYFPSRFWVRNYLIRISQIRAFSLSDGVIFLTKYAKDRIEILTGPIKNYRIIPHGFQHFDAIKKKDYNLSKTVRLVYVSPTWKFKDHMCVLKAANQIKKCSFDFEMLFLGENKREYKNFQRLKSYIKENNLSKNIIFKGNVDHTEVIKTISQCDIFIFASLCENMPNTLVEAMGVGLPIVSSNAGPMPEVLKDGGFYYEKSNHEDLVKVIIKLIDDDEARSKMGLRAAELAKNFDWAFTSQKTIEYLENFYEVKKSTGR